MTARWLFVVALPTLASGLVWAQTAAAPEAASETKLLASDGAAGDSFGKSVSISSNTALVGARWDDDNGEDSGSAYVYVKSGNLWIGQAKLLPSDGEAGDYFGYSVVVSGDTALLGAPDDDDNGLDSGSAYIFVRSGEVWIEQAKLLASDGEAWTEQGKLVASDAAPDDYFGVSVSLSEDTALVGAWGDDDNGADAGAAYAFVRSAGVWTEQQKLLASDGEVGDYLGEAVSVSGDAALVGASWDDDYGIDAGSAYIYVRSGGQLNWRPETEGGSVHWGRNWRARTMGPATSCGKKVTKSA